MASEEGAPDPSKSARCVAGSCAGPVAPGQTECISHRLHHTEGRRQLIAELRGEVAPRPAAMPVAVVQPIAVVVPPSPLLACTLPPARSLWE